MKKLILLIALVVLAISTASALDPLKVAIYKPGGAANVQVFINDYTGGSASTKYTGTMESLTPNGSGIIIADIVGGTLATIAAGDVNSYYVVDVHVGGTLYAQYRLDQLILSQAQGGVLDSEGNLTPPEAGGGSVGSDDNRWGEVFVEENTVHIGPDGGTAGNTELALSYDGGTNTGLINVDGGNPEISIDANSNIIKMDANGDGILNMSLTPSRLSINTGVGADLFISEDKLFKLSNINETFTLENQGTGDLNLFVDGKISAAGLVANSVLITDASGNLVTDTDLLYSTGSKLLDVKGAIYNSGAALKISDDLEVLGNISNGSGDVNINDNLNVSGSNNFSVGTGTASFDGNVALGNGGGDDIAANGKFTTNLTPKTDDDANLGTNGSRWKNLNISTNANIDNNANIANNANVGNNATINGNLRLVESGGGTDVVGFKAPAAVASNQVWTLPAADGSSGQALTTDGSGNLSWASTSSTYSGQVTIAAPNAGGTEAIANVNVVSGSVIIVTRVSTTGAQLTYHISSINAGVGFTVQFSASVTAGDQINYIIINP